MRRIGFVAILVLALSTVAKADSACSTATLATYISQGSCTLGPLTFSGFSYVPNASGGATNPGTGGMTIIPTLSGLMFEFAGAWTVNSNQTLDSIITFAVSAGSAIINDLSLTLVSAGCAGTASIGLTENTNPLTSPATNLFADCSNINITQTNTFAPVSWLTLIKDLSISGGTNGNAAVSEFTNAVSVVPEPGSLLLFGSGLVAMGGVVRRRLGRQKDTK
jgi:hypothetical protein